MEKFPHGCQPRTFVNTVNEVFDPWRLAGLDRPLELIGQHVDAQSIVAVDASRIGCMAHRVESPSAAGNNSDSSCSLISCSFRSTALSEQSRWRAISGFLRPSS